MNLLFSRKETISSYIVGEETKPHNPSGFPLRQFQISLPQIVANLLKASGTHPETANYDKWNPADCRYCKKPTNGIRPWRVAVPANGQRFPCDAVENEKRLNRKRKKVCSILQNMQTRSPT